MVRDVKKVIITGVNGFIGSALAKYMLLEGMTVAGIGREPLSVVAGIRYHQKDLLKDDITELLKDYQPDCLVHCAGTADVNASMSYPSVDFEHNVVMAQRMFWQMVKGEICCRVLFLSSAAVYGQPEKLPVREEELPEPLSPYALHKQMTEDMCFYFIRQYQMDIRILRVFSAYGPGLKKQLLWDMGNKLMRTGRLDLSGTGMESRDYIYISDLVRAVSCVMNRPVSGCDFVINIASGTETTIENVADIFVREWDRSSDVVCFNGIRRTGNPVNWCADITRLKKLGFRCQISLEQGIREYVRWFRSTCIQ